MAATAIGEYRPHEIAAGIIVALLVQVGAGVALHVANVDRVVVAHEAPSEVPVRVMPVVDLDAPLLKLGGKRNKAKLPDRWVKPAPVARVEDKAFVSPKAEKTADKIPEKSTPVASASVEPPPPDAELTKQVDTPTEAPVASATPAANVDEEGAADGSKAGTETDPLKARAVDLYRARIASWFSSRFRVHGSGLPQSELTTYRVRATVQLSADRQVTGYTISSSGNAAFDAAARSMLESTKGSQIPPPPENYPDTIQSQISLTLLCTENRCD